MTYKRRQVCSRNRAKNLMMVFSLFCLSAALPVNADETMLDGEETMLPQHRMENIKRDIRHGKRRLRIEVAENGTAFGFDQGQPLDANGFPLYGNNFITQGYIYPAGTLSANAEGIYNGVNADGSPEFPDKVLGTWICRGWVLGEDGFNIASGRVVATTQIFDFEKVAGRFGKITLITDGTELIDVDVPIYRAITGGTGPYRLKRGQMKQTLLGMNQTLGVSVRFNLGG